MLHHNKIHKLMKLNNKDESRLRADLTLKRQIEYLKDTFCIVYIETVTRKFFLIQRNRFPDF